MKGYLRVAAEGRVPQQRSGWTSQRAASPDRSTGRRPRRVCEHLAGVVVVAAADARSAADVGAQETAARGETSASASGEMRATVGARAAARAADARAAEELQ